MRWTDYPNRVVKGAIFDLDGTLLDSMHIWNTAGERYLLSLGIRTRENLAETFKEMSLTQAADYCRRTYSIDKTIEEITNGFNEIVEAFYMEEVSLKDGIKVFLQSLADANVKMCIATATDRYLVEAALVRLSVRDYFEEIFTCTDVGHGKDEPVIYEKALQYLGTEKYNTIVFEDAVHAIKTAKKAGFIVAGVYDESEENQEEVRELADYYLLRM